MSGIRDYGNLKRKIIATTLCFSFAPLLALGVSMYALFSESVTARMTDSIRTMAENRCNAIDLFLEERIAQLRTLAYTHSVDKLQEEGYLESVLKIMQEQGRAFIDLGLIDHTGSHLAYTGPYSLHGVNYAGQQWFQEVMERGVFVSDVFWGFRNEPHFVIAVLRREGERLWVLRATIDTDLFDGLVKTAVVGIGGDSFLINRDGLLQTHPRWGGSIGTKITYLDLSVFSGVRIEQLNLQGQRALLASTWLQSKDWLLVIREDPKEELVSLLRARHVVVGLGVLGIIVIVVGAVLVARRMISQLRQADHENEALNESLIQSAKLADLGVLSASIAHEVNNPLAIIKERIGWMQDLLQEEDPSQCKNLEELVQSAQSIESSADRAGRIIERILNFSRTSRPTRETVEVNRLVEQTIEFVRKEARNRRISIGTELFQDLPPTSSDPTQLQQIILNILNNALDAIGSDGAIHIKTGVNPSQKDISISIVDDGPGIPNELMNRIFQPFFTTKEPGKGTGLGLCICNTIVQKLGGRIMVASEVGKGTTFTIYLPLSGNSA